MKESLLTCDICKETTGETHIATERVAIQTLRHGTVRKDVCEQHYKLVMENVPKWFGEFAEGAGEAASKKVAAKSRRPSGQRATASVRPRGRQQPVREVSTNRNGNAQRGGLRKAILTELSAHPDRTYTAATMAAAIGHDRPRTGQSMANMVKDGRVERVGTGEYRIGRKAAAQPTLV